MKLFSLPFPAQTPDADNRAYIPQVSFRAINILHATYPQIGWVP